MEQFSFAVKPNVKLLLRFTIFLSSATFPTNDNFVDNNCLQINVRIRTHNQ